MTKRLSKDERAALYERDDHDVFYSYEVRSLIDHIDELEAESDELRSSNERLRRLLRTFYNAVYDGNEIYNDTTDELRENGLIDENDELIYDDGGEDFE